MTFALRKKEELGELPLVLDDFEEPFISKKWPAVHATVFTCTFPDGTYRKPGLFTCWRGPEGVTVKVVDNELDMGWQHTAPTFEKALSVIEGQIAAGKLGNRSNKARSEPRPKRKG